MEINDSFLSEQTARECYDEQYSKGYMDQVDPINAERIREVIQNAKLPLQGVALDFGCGSGSFSEILQQELPGWTIVGTDLSPIALKKAKERVPSMSVASIDDCSTQHNFFDLIFSRHVLEHVQNIEDTFALFDRLAKKQSWLLHVCPCGNPGSLEHSICLMRDNGIAPNGRFFFEDPSHLRRLSTKDMQIMGENIEFAIIDEYYTNQYHGALRWISTSGFSFQREFFNMRKTKGLLNKAKMVLFLCLAMPVYGKLASRLFKAPNPSLKRRLLRPFFLPLWPCEKIFSITRLTQQEWKDSSKQPNGSEMYILFKRG